MNNKLYNKLTEIVGENNIWLDEPMDKHTTFRVGGPADYYVVPASAGQISRVAAAASEADVPFYILGNGSNLLVGDKGYRGVIIQIYKNMEEIAVEERCIRVQAGALLSKVAKAALENSLQGFEFAAGIPGTMGGAVVMNAGAYGGEMKQVIREAAVLDETGEIHTLGVDELELGYRTSIIRKKHYIVLEAVIELESGDAGLIAEKMNGLRLQRTEKQPLDLPSAGSTFKRPEGYFAGKLIMDAGLRGYRVGGAQVSEKHCGFVVNAGGATAADIQKLIADVKDVVFEKYGIMLEPEVKMLGEF